MGLLSVMLGPILFPLLGESSCLIYVDILLMFGSNIPPSPHPLIDASPPILNVDNFL